MRTRPLLLLLALVAATPLAASAQAKFKLKPGANGATCLECHVKFAEVLKRPFVHTPVKARTCTGCHAPHAAKHAKLLAGTPAEACLQCHTKVVPAAAKSVHAPVAEGKCTGCHDPHASTSADQLVKPQRELCAGCHKAVTEAAAKAKFKHKPLEQKGCGACHQTHGSANGEHLLASAVPGLCAGCHKTDKPIFKKQHVGYDVGSSNCTSCHDAHGSDRRGLLYDRVHSPVAKAMCAQCHEAPGAPRGFAPKAVGVALCRGCHNEKVNAMLAKNRLHTPAIADRACLTCHSPHASKGKGLLRASPQALCGSCHADTIKRQETSATKHQPVADGDCTSCHDPHAGDKPFLFVNATTLELCANCHEWKNHSAHPMGDKAKDPRNRNLRVDCLSCHRAHGTEYKRMFPYATQTDLCVKCHTQYKR